MAELSKTYDPASVEQKWYARWIADGCFKADAHSAKPPFSIVIPPPNITGVLTLGHVLNTTIQDILARRARMQGHEVLWLPGMDHAGIGTQTAVEKWLRKNEGVTRHDLGREKFLVRVLEWQDKHGGIIIEQLKRLGCSCDWSRQRYTFDDAYVRAVEKVFVDLYKKGLIYRGRRMINWDPAAQTAISDEEVINKPQKGNLYYVRYEIVEEPGRFIEVATTRPETIMADTGVAAHPNDKRYADLIGKHTWRPLAREKIPIVADEAIDPEFGTGLLKVTPAHDKLDFEIGQRHKLPVIDVLTATGRIDCPSVPELHGLDRFEARKKAAELLESRQLLSKTEPHENNVGFSDRSDVPIEPRLSEQWFLKYPAVNAAKLAVQGDGLMNFVPYHWRMVYLHWMANIQDWCISRQVWWGHRIPVWTRALAGSEEAASDFLVATLAKGRLKGYAVEIFDGAVVELDKERLNWSQIKNRIPSASPDVRERRITVCTSSRDLEFLLASEGFEQDPDVLDTWFSSWIWPFATMGWTGNVGVDRRNELLTTFYPTSALVTGPDIIFFWVARMIMAGFEFMAPLLWEGDEFESLAPERRWEFVRKVMPFRNVFFTGLIRDKQGRKMSKSLGNSPDPLDLIAKYGADGLRFGLMRIAPSGQDIRFDEKQIEEGRNFATKLWNAARFRQMHGPSEASPTIDETSLSVYAVEVLARLNETIDAVEEAYRTYEFNIVAQRLYDFFWNDYCDWFIEAAKSDIFGDDEARKKTTLTVMDIALSAVLRLLHPFMPHITEELWSIMQLGTGSIEAVAPPQNIVLEEANLDELRSSVSGFYNFVVRLRMLRAQHNVPSTKKVSAVYHHRDRGASDENWATISRLAGISSLQFVQDYHAAAGEYPEYPPFGGVVYLQLGSDVVAERERLDKEIAKLENELRTVAAKLKNKSFVDRAPASVVAEHRQREKDFAERLAQLRRMRDELN